MSSLPTPAQERNAPCTWKQQRGSPVRPTQSQLETSALSREGSFEPTTTTTNGIQSRQCQREDKTEDEQVRHSRRTTDTQPTESPGGSDALRQDVPPLLLPPSRTRHEAVLGVVDTTVEKRRKTRDVIPDVGAVESGKGIIAASNEQRKLLNESVGGGAAPLTEPKTSRPWGNLTGVLVVVVGGGLIVAGGAVVCQMYPLSSVAASIQVAAGRVEEGLLTLLVTFWHELKPYADRLGQAMQVKWLALLRSTTLGKAARAMEMQAVQGVFAFIRLEKAVDVCFGLMESLQDQLRLVCSGFVDVWKFSMEWIRSGFMELIGDGELFKQTQALLMKALSVVAESLKQCGTVMAWSLGNVLEWLGTESDMSDVNLPREQLIAPVVTHQGAIQKIGKELTEQEFRAVHDVKRFEERRVTIASATNSIIEDTRAVALESVLNLKMAAVKLIQERTRQLVAQYARAFEQALKDYERTSWQAEAEGGFGILADLTTKNQAQIDAAESLKRYLWVHEKVVDDKVTKAPVLGDQTFVKDELRDEPATEYQPVDSQLVEETKHSGGLSEVSVMKEEMPAKGMPESNLKDVEGSQLLVEIASGDVVTVELREAPALDYSSSEKALESERVSEAQAHVLTVEVSEVSVVGKSSLSEKAVEGDHVTDDQLQIVANHTEVDVLNAALDSMDKDEAVNEVEETFTTQVLVDLDNSLLQVELRQSEVSKLYGVRNLSEEEAQLKQKNRVDAHWKASVDGTDVELMETLTVVADEKSFEEVEVEQALAGIRARVVAEAGIEVEGNIEKQECTQKDCKETSLTGDMDLGTQNEQLDVASVLKVQVDVDGVIMLTEPQHTEEYLASAHSHDEAVVEMKIQKGPVGVADEAQRERTGYLEMDGKTNAATLTIVDMSESERMIAAGEILELEQLEQFLQEDELIQIEEELRVIAEEEGIWLHSEEVVAEGEMYQDDAVSGQRMTVMKRAEAVAEFESEDWQTNSRDELLVLPRPAMMQIGLFSMAFFGLMALTLYLFARHRKREFFARSPRRGRRWQRLADMSESEAEEVVLLPDDSSDEEDGTDVAVVKQSSLKVVRRIANVGVEAIEVTSCGGEEDGKKEETSATHKSAKEKDDALKEKDRDAESSRLIVTECAQTLMYTVDNPVTSDLDALADDSDTASVSPMTPTQEKADTSQRTNLRRRGIRT